MRLEPMEGILAVSAIDDPLPRIRVELVLQRRPEGVFTVAGFPDEVHVNEEHVRCLDPDLVRLERERLYIYAANGEAVYVPLSASPLRGFRRYGRLYLRGRDHAA